MRSGGRSGRGGHRQPEHLPRALRRHGVLHAGDHPFVQHPTCVYYSDARITTVARLEIAIRQRQAIQRAEMDAALVERIRAGLYRSPFTVHALRERCRAFFGPPEE